MISMAQCKTAVSPLLTQWRYCSLALTHRCEPSRDTVYPIKYVRNCDIDLFRTTTKHNIARTAWCVHVLFLAGTNPNFNNTMCCMLLVMLTVPGALSYPMFSRKFIKTYSCGSHSSDSLLLFGPMGTNCDEIYITIQNIKIQKCS